jgi:hypothetical protein
MSNHSRGPGIVFAFAAIAALAASAAFATSAVAPAAGPTASGAIDLEEMRQPDAREPGDGPVSDRVETGANRLLGVIDWSGLRFLHYETRTYWTADSGRSWKSHGWTLPDPKGTRLTLPDGRFRTTGSGLFLAGGDGALVAARFDPVRDDFAWLDFGVAAARVTALGSDAGALYRYDLRGILSVSRDDGVSWHTVATVPYPSGGYPFEGVEAEGDLLLLRFDPAAGISTDAGSFDGGKTWKWFPPGADAHLSGGCFHYVADDSLRSECAPGTPDRKVRAPFRRLRRLFTQTGGERYALADSGVFRYQAGDPAAGDGKPHWEPVGAPADWAGWVMAGELFSKQTAEKAAWVSPGPPLSVSLARGARSRTGYCRSGSRPLPPWLDRGRRPDGRALSGPSRRAVR